MIIEWILFILPAYVANALPVLVSGRTPMDLGQRFSDGERVLGRGKTFRGFLTGVFGGFLVGAALAVFAPQFLVHYSFNDKLIISFLLSTGAMVGDTAGSFVKRRLGIGQGRKLRAVDRLGFLATALVFSVVAYPKLADYIGLAGLVFLVALTLLVHRAINAIAHYLKLKTVPW